MDLHYPRCVGLDVHKDSVVACVRVARAGGVDQQVRTFETRTVGLLALSSWLSENEVTHVAMEATGVYWKPVWHVLEGNFELVLANAAHIRNVPGRKTDVNDAMWIADLLAHGLIRGSFVPPAPVQEMRDLTRTRKQFVREVAQHTLRIQKVLEDANIKITGLITDLLGVSGRAILGALAQGPSTPEQLADLAKGRLKAKRAALIEALTGRVTDHHRFLLRSHLRTIQMLEGEIKEVDERIGTALEPFHEPARRLIEIPGISTVAAYAILSEIGVDMARFPTAGHLLSWATLCPRSDESAGKVRSKRMRPGGTWIKTMMIQAAWAASRARDSYFQAQFQRIKSRRGPKKAVGAVAASLLTVIYHMLQRGTRYQDLGHDHFNRRDKEKIAKRLIRRLEDLGLQVQIQEAA
jgi:transposase